MLVSILLQDPSEDVGDPTADDKAWVCMHLLHMFHYEGLPMDSSDIETYVVGAM